MTALQMLWTEGLAPLAQDMAPAIAAAMASFRPDAMVVDQQAIGGALHAHHAAVPWITLATSPGELATLTQAQTAVRQWTATVIANLSRELGCGLLDQGARFSPFGTLMTSCAALMGDVPEGTVVHAVGCLVAHRRLHAPSMPMLPGPRILVSMGTVSDESSRRFLASTLEAAGATPHLTWVIVDRTGMYDGRHLPNVQLTHHVDMVSMLPTLAAVVCHAGHNTVAEALLHHVPVVVAPIRDDQPIVASRVEAAGAGIRLRFSHATGVHIADAVSRVIADDSFRRQAALVGAQLDHAEARVRQLLLPWLRAPANVMASPSACDLA